LILKELGRIPKVAEFVEINDIRLTVNSLIGVKLDKIEIEYLRVIE
jgi:CBS domain containing-hemolysin-like protein